MHHDPIEDFDDDDDEIVFTAVPSESARKASHWLMLAAVIEMIADVFGVFHKFFNTLEDEVLANYRWKRSRFEFAEQAAREIETMTGGFDATTHTASSG